MDMTTTPKSTPKSTMKSTKESKQKTLQKSTQRSTLRATPELTPKPVVKPVVKTTPESYKATSARQLLLEELRRRQRKNPRYSLRAFAQHLGLSPGRLSHFISGKRPITPQAMTKICEHLPVSPSTQAKLVAKLKRRRSFRVVDAPSDDEFFLLGDKGFQESDDMFHIIAEWEHFALLSLIRIRGQSHDPDQLAQRLGVATSRVERAIERLCNAGLLLRERGRLIRTHERLRTTDGIANRAIRFAHKSVLERALECLDSVPLELTDVTSITLPIALRKLPEASERLKAFRREMCEFLEGEDADEVYRLNLQLVPVTKVPVSKVGVTK